MISKQLKQIEDNYANKINIFTFFTDDVEKVRRISDKFLLAILLFDFSDQSSFDYIKDEYLFFRNFIIIGYHYNKELIEVNHDYVDLYCRREEVNCEYFKIQDSNIDTSLENIYNYILFKVGK